MFCTVRASKDYILYVEYSMLALQLPLGEVGLLKFHTAVLAARYPSRSQNQSCCELTATTLNLHNTIEY